MKCYAIVELDVTDPSWVKPYLKDVTGLIEAHGGRYLARTNRAEALEGDRPVSQMVLIIEWPSHEHLMAFYESEAYRPHLEGRLNGSRAQLTVVPGEDVTRRAASPA